MKSSNGWIKLHRKIKEKGYYRNSRFLHLWIHLLLSANHKPKEFMFNGNVIIIKEGQLLTGRKRLSEDTGISESTIERVLTLLENEQQIEQQKSTKSRIITILKWREYQIVDSDSDNKRTTDGQQMDTNKNDKNDKNDKKKERPQSLEEIKALFRERNYTDPDNQAEMFLNHYTANGWKVGRNPMKDWKAAAANWNKNAKEWGSKPADKFHPQAQAATKFPCPRGCGAMLTETGKEAHLLYQCTKTVKTERHDSSTPSLGSLVNKQGG